MKVCLYLRVDSTFKLISAISETYNCYVYMVVMFIWLSWKHISNHAHMNDKILTRIILEISDFLLFAAISNTNSGVMRTAEVLTNCEYT
jgi:hypothetical protein